MSISTQNPSPKKRKVIEDSGDEVKEERVGKRGAPKPASRKVSKVYPKASSSKASSKGKTKASTGPEDDIIDISSDDDYLKSYMDQRNASNMASIAIMGQNQKVRLLRERLINSEAKNQELQLKILQLEFEKKVQQGVQEALAQQYLIVPPAAPAPAPAPAPLFMPTIAAPAAILTHATTATAVGQGELPVPEAAALGCPTDVPEQPN
ncbi:hypothetical protein RSOL_120760, partial [Rhizoctonia solani AG-3 Rhs1AP]